MDPREGKSPEWCKMFDALVAEGHTEEEAAKMANAKNMSADQTVFDLADVEIFAAGKWKGEEYTTEDLDNMVHNFDLLGRKYKAPLKLGHDDKQKLAQADGYPAIGWVKEIKRSGEKLLATFTSVPKKIKDLIDKKAYGRFSSEVLWNFNFGGNVHKRVLRGVALLGADMPAVTSISDILALYSEGDILQGELHAYHDLMENKKEVGKNMPTTEELQAQLDAQKQQIAKLSQDVTSKDSEIEKLNAEKQQREQEEQKTKVFSAIDEGIKAGKIAPVQREFLAALAMSQAGTERVIKFSDGKEEKYPSSLDLLNGMIAKLPANSKFSEQSTTGKEKTQEKQDTIIEGGRAYSTDEAAHEKIQAIQKEKKCSYTEAFAIYSQEVK